MHRTAVDGIDALEHGPPCLACAHVGSSQRGAALLVRSVLCPLGGLALPRCFVPVSVAHRVVTEAGRHATLPKQHTRTHALATRLGRG